MSPEQGGKCRYLLQPPGERDKHRETLRIAVGQGSWGGSGGIRPINSREEEEKTMTFLANQKKVI